jgi:Na+-transporting methylmalonyl-CoA/oxaloacetate decarboxylase gamma subunit
MSLVFIFMLALIVSWWAISSTIGCFVVKETAEEQKHRAKVSLLMDIGGTILWGAFYYYSHHQS